ncbi:hypothetical protein [Phenylobacterium sp.]|jgi:hypothetical protein|uniref:hypothetical protein n=1 Tax=Phenylobacterium sp. TaxID=1871053 RepID=UPI002F427F0C
MRDLTLIARNSRWVLLDENVAELGQFATEGAALTAASGYVRAWRESAFILIGDADGEWREEQLLPESHHH